MLMNYAGSPDTAGTLASALRAVCAGQLPPRWHARGAALAEVKAQGHGAVTHDHVQLAMNQRGATNVRLAAALRRGGYGVPVCLGPPPPPRWVSGGRGEHTAVGQGWGAHAPSSPPARAAHESGRRARTRPLAGPRAPAPRPPRLRPTRARAPVRARAPPRAFCRPGRATLPRRPRPGAGRTRTCAGACWQWLHHTARRAHTLHTTVA